jgi:hypothetical protein
MDKGVDTAVFIPDRLVAALQNVFHGDVLSFVRGALAPGASRRKMNAAALFSSAMVFSY